MTYEQFVQTVEHKVKEGIGEGVCVSIHRRLRRSCRRISLYSRLRLRNHKLYRKRRLDRQHLTFRYSSAAKEDL